jgi:hypothetical protein
MKCNTRSFAVVSILLAVLLSSSTRTLNPRDADLASLTLAAAQTAKQQCVNVCRARYRDCFSLKQIPSFECRDTYQDCIRFTCNAVKGYPTRLAGDAPADGDRTLLPKSHSG